MAWHCWLAVVFAGKYWHSSSFDNGKAKYYGAQSTLKNFSLHGIICRHVLAYRTLVSILNSKKIACHQARSGFSTWNSDLFKLMTVLYTVTAQNIGPVSTGHARPPTTPMWKYHIASWKFYVRGNFHQWEQMAKLEKISSWWKFWLYKEIIHVICVLAVLAIDFPNNCY